MDFNIFSSSLEYHIRTKNDINKFTKKNNETIKANLRIQAYNWPQSYTIDVNKLHFFLQKKKQFNNFA